MRIGNRLQTKLVLPNLYEQAVICYTDSLCTPETSSKKRQIKYINNKNRLRVKKKKNTIYVPTFLIWSKSFMGTWTAWLPYISTIYPIVLFASLAKKVFLWPLLLDCSHVATNQHTYKTSTNPRSFVFGPIVNFPKRIQLLIPQIRKIGTSTAAYTCRITTTG